MQDSLAISSYL